MTDPRCWHELATENAALRAANARLREALTDMLSGWRYIRRFHGDLEGVGWNRAESAASAALAHGIAHDQAPYDPEK